jgi:acetyl-CoA carboxylase carboxyl transferase subunit beta
MNWITNFVKPKLQALINKKIEVPENLWTKCNGCEHMLFHRDLKANLGVCHHCDAHMRISAKERLHNLFDNGLYTLQDVPKAIHDPLKFKDSKRYTDRLKEYRHKTGNEDSVLVAFGQVKGHNIVACIFDFDFMGGSMGLYAGQAMVKAAELAVRSNSPLLAITASGGARMQEGILSLMQMPRTTIAVQMVKEAGLPYITLLTDPTTGGVSASFAMLGDITLAEPGAIIGFTGARVIEETIRQKLPEGFQRAEYLLDHGMVDIVVPRKEISETLAKVLHHLRNSLRVVH